MATWIQVLKCSLLVLCFVCIAPCALTAQSNEPSIVVAQFPDDGPITFLAIYADGTTTQVGSLPSEFRGPTERFRPNEIPLDITAPDSIVISPDQQYAAISAQQNQAYKLYIFRTTGEQIWEVDIETPARMSWSPDNEGFAFVTDRNHYNGEEIGVAYFDLETGQVISLARENQAYIPFFMKWINDQILVLNVIDEAIDERILIKITRDGEITQIFPNIRCDEYSNETIGEYEWSEQLQVFFVEAGCFNDEDFLLSKLYQVDLDGNATLLLSAPDDYSDPSVDQARYLITGIEVYGENVYVLTHQYGYDFDTSGDLQIFDDIWRVMRWRDGEWLEIASGNGNQDLGIKNPTISTDGRYVVFYEYRYGINPNLPAVPHTLIVIDLVTGEVVRRAKTFAKFSDSITWFDDYRFLFADSYYGGGDAIMSPLAQIIDLSRTPMDGFIVPLEDPIWLAVNW
jgi:hypothetical protein